MQSLTLLAYAASLILTISCLPEDMAFVERKNALLCAKEEFIYYPDNPWDAQMCIDTCKISALCQAYSLPDKSKEIKCQLYHFNKCSHAINKPNCTDRGSVWVRAYPNANPLCQRWTAFSHGSSRYMLRKMPDNVTSSWQMGLDVCESQSGLSKYADANDEEEAAFFEEIRTQRYNTPFFVGGYRPPNSSEWLWLSCKTSIKPELWVSGQPSVSDPQHRYTEIRSMRLSTTPNTDHLRNDNRILCECVDPFWSRS